MQVGASEVYDAIDSNPDISSEFAASDDAGYLDLVAEHSLEPGIHNVSYKVRSRKPVNANLFTIPSGTKVGVISDVDDTIMVTQAPRLMKAAYNLLLLNPRKKVPVASMNLLFVFRKVRCCCATLTRGRRRSCRPACSTSWNTPNSSWPIFRI